MSGVGLLLERSTLALLVPTCELLSLRRVTVPVPLSPLGLLPLVTEVPVVVPRSVAPPERLEVVPRFTCEPPVLLGVLVVERVTVLGVLTVLERSLVERFTWGDTVVVLRPVLELLRLT